MFVIVHKLDLVVIIMRNFIWRFEKYGRAICQVTSSLYSY